MAIATGPELLQRLLRMSLVLSEDWDSLPLHLRTELENCSDPIELVDSLVTNKLLTEYQASRALSGKTYGMVLGNYRVLEKIGAGGMGVVYKAEHIRMRRLAAIKVLAQHDDNNDDGAAILGRFFSEIRSVASLHHPNIVSAIDAGDVRSPNPELPVLHYYVMEYVPGRDLEAHVNENGPLSVPQACDLAYQLASALAAAHKHHMVHRDIKPANVLRTPDGQAKLLDFGLARHLNQKVTEPGTVLGTVDYMAPEQIRDPSAVDIRADIYSLGGTLYWALCGEVPFPTMGSLNERLQVRLTRPPPSVRALNSAVDPELDHLVARMMALEPSDRYPTPESVMRALLPFLAATSRVLKEAPTGRGSEGSEGLALPGTPTMLAPTAVQPHRVLIIDDEPGIQAIATFALRSETLVCESASSGAAGLATLNARPFDVVLLDVDMPGMSGTEVLQTIRSNPPWPRLKVVMISGRASPDEMALMLQSGADDYLTKPFSIVQLRARLTTALHLKEAQDRSDHILRSQTGIVGEMERRLATGAALLEQSHLALVRVATEIVEKSQTESLGHLVRIQRFARCLAEEAARVSSFRDAITPEFIKALEHAAPLHDLGKLAIPEEVRLKPGTLTLEERLTMQEHSALGGEMLLYASQHFAASVPFLPLAEQVARHHHERWDGNGYPDGLAGEAIPLAARILAIADVYDALRRRTTYKPALAHPAAFRIITEESAGQFDPDLVDLFKLCAPQWQAIFQEYESR
jgi:response regulator RpfG family c-di-GMP phosphodiesterase/serine/threonine protein kinase